MVSLCPFQTTTTNRVDNHEWQGYAVGITEYQKKTLGGIISYHVRTLRTNGNTRRVNAVAPEAHEQTDKDSKPPVYSAKRAFSKMRDLRIVAFDEAINYRLCASSYVAFISTFNGRFN